MEAVWDVSIRGARQLHEADPVKELLPVAGVETAQGVSLRRGSRALRGVAVPLPGAAPPA